MSDSASYGVRLENRATRSVGILFAFALFLEVVWWGRNVGMADCVLSLASLYVLLSAGTRVGISRWGRSPWSDVFLSVAAAAGVYAAVQEDVRLSTAFLIGSAVLYWSQVHARGAAVGANQESEGTPISS